MKLLTIILLGISSLFINSDIGEEIDFNPRLLQKELSNLLCGEDFKMHELKLPDSIVGNNKVNGKFFTITCTEGNKLLAYIGRVQSCRVGVCSIQRIDDPEDEYEYFDYFILFDSQKRVKIVRVYNYEATHGQEIMVKGWLNQFVGYDGSKTLRVGKEIDSISGATISALGLTADVQLKTSFLKPLKFF
jgi:hypothetical protein